jgi:hypothetical protein
MRGAPASRSADWQSAVSPAGSRRKRDCFASYEIPNGISISRSADYQSATQQTASPRYSRDALEESRLVKMSIAGKLSLCSF